MHTLQIGLVIGRKMGYRSECKQQSNTDNLKHIDVEYLKRSEEVMSTMYQYSFDLIRNSKLYSFGQDGIVELLVVIIGIPPHLPTQNLLCFLFCLSSKPLQISEIAVWRIHTRRLLLEYTTRHVVLGIGAGR